MSKEIEGLVPLTAYVERGADWDKEAVEETPAQKSGNVWGSKVETKAVSLAQVQEEEKKNRMVEKEKQQYEDRQPQGTYKPSRSRDNPGPRDFNSGPRDYTSGPRDYNSGPRDYNSGPRDYNSGGRDYNSGGRDYNSGRREYAPRDPQQPREKQPVPSNPPYTAYVGNLPYDMADESFLFEYFGALGVEDIRVVKDPQNDRPKGYAYIQFTEREGLVNALCADGEDFNGRPLLVDVASTRDRSGPDDRSRWGPRDGSGSASGFGVRREREREERPVDSRYDSSGPSSWRSQPRANTGPVSAGGPPKLGLQPRTKPVEDIGTPVKRAGEDPFGGASNDAEKLRKQTEERLRREEESERKRREQIERAQRPPAPAQPVTKDTWRGPREERQQEGRGQRGGRGGNDKRYDNSWGPGANTRSATEPRSQRAPEQKKGPSKQEQEKAEAVANPFSVLTENQ